MSRHVLRPSLRHAIRQAAIAPPDSAWTPTDDANLAVWFDFSDPAFMFTDAGITPVDSDGDLVYQVNNKVGGSYSLENNTESIRPTYRENVRNGQDALEFAADYLYRLAGAYPNLGQDYTVWGAIVLAAGGTQFKQLWSQGVNNVFAGIDSSVPAIYIRAGGASNITAPIPAVGTWFRFLITHKGSTNDTQIYVNGSSAGSGAAGTANLDFGTATYWGTNSSALNRYYGHWGEMGFRTGIADATLISNIDTYLVNKWDL